MASHAPGLTAPHTTVLACQEQVGSHALKEVHRLDTALSELGPDYLLLPYNASDGEEE